MILETDYSVGNLDIYCGVPAIAAEMQRSIAAAGYSRPQPLKLIIDVPAGYAFSMRDFPHRTETVVLTDNRCPEYLLDLREFGFLAVLAGGNTFHEVLQHGLERAARGDRFYSGPELTSSLTSSERAVLRHVALGLSDKQIAIQLNKSERTVSNQISSILMKISLKNRVQALIYYLSLTHLLPFPLE